MTDVTDVDLGIGFDPAPGATGEASVLAGDGIPDENQSLTCFSCDSPMTDLYCGNCGQKNDDYRRPLWKLGAEAFAAFTAFENRIWRTWGNLLARPGRVPREYADGRRTHWSSPVRVYIFMSILLFGFMEVTGTYFFAVELDLEQKETVDTPEDQLTPDDVQLDWSVHLFPTDAQVETWNSDLDFGLLQRKLAANGGAFDGIDLELGEMDDVEADDVGVLLAQIRSRSNNFTPREREEAIAALEGVRDNLKAQAVGPAAPGLNKAALEIDKVIATQRERLAQQRETEVEEAEVEDETVEPVAEDDTSDSVILGVTGENDLIIGGQPVSLDARNRLLLDFIRNPAIGNNILNRWLPRIIFLMMPLTMLIAALFIRGRGKRYKRGPKAGQYKGHEALLYDHVVHAAYIHAVAYLMLFVGILASRVIDGGLAAQIIFFALMIYLPLSLRRMFRRGWFKTIWTAYGVAFIYLVIIFSLTVWAVASGISEEIAAREALL